MRRLRRRDSRLCRRLCARSLSAIWLSLTRRLSPRAALLIASANAEQARAAEDDAPSEQTITADESVALSVCLESGDITVRSWERREVHARTSSGGQLELRRTDAANTSAPATRIEVLM